MMEGSEELGRMLLREAKDKERGDVTKVKELLRKGVGEVFRDSRRLWSPDSGAPCLYSKTLGCGAPAAGARSSNDSARAGGPLA